MSTEPELQAKILRLHTGEASSSVSASRSVEERGVDTEEILARIAWSRLTEPGDGTAGVILRALGARASLELLIAGAKPAALTTAVHDAGADLDMHAAELGLGRWLPRLSRERTIADIDRALTQGLRIAVPGDEYWPTDALERLGVHAPNMLWLRGDPRLLQTRSLSVVGARAATGYGTHITAEIVGGVCDAGITIVSGAAYGIDAVAHRTALATQTSTIAVLAGGADRAYPAAHHALLERIGEVGLVCGEMIPGSAPTRWRFRMRNRIIAALSEATLVTEAGVRSGTLNTAGHVSELGHTLGAVPGPVTSAASAGCHKLIREYGAVLVTNAREACEMIGVSDQLEILTETPTAATQRTKPLHERLLDAVPLRGSREVSEVARRSGTSVAEARGGLAELELLGRVRRGETPDTSEEKWSLLRR